MRSYPTPVLVEPPLGYNCYIFGGCCFRWAWGGALKPDEYFQVQIIGPNNQHRGIYPPTKACFFQSNEMVYLIFQDWFDKRKFAKVKWTVAVIEWDGKDPSELNRYFFDALRRGAGDVGGGRQPAKPVYLR